MSKKIYLISYSTNGHEIQKWCNVCSRYVHPYFNFLKCTWVVCEKNCIFAIKQFDYGNIYIESLGKKPLHVFFRELGNPPSFQAINSAQYMTQSNANSEPVTYEPPINMWVRR